MDEAKLKASIRLHEGFRAMPYRDTKGKLTIGIGRNLDDVPLTEEEAWYLARGPLEFAINNAHLLVHYWPNLNDARQNVLIELVYNIGLRGALGFKKMRAALDAEDYAEAAAQLWDSKWATDVGPNRTSDMARQLRNGEWSVE